MPTRDNKNLLLFPFYPHVLSGQNFRRKNPVFQIPVRCFIPLIDNDPKKAEHHKIHESPNPTSAKSWGIFFRNFFDTFFQHPPLSLFRKIGLSLSMDI